MTELREGFIEDRATKKPVDCRKPEEPVRQEYEKILNEDYGYDYGQMDIEVVIQRGEKNSKKNKTGERADIVIYKTTNKSHRDQNSDIVGIVETKRPEREEGVEQLMSYMSATSCLWGVWTNGNDIEYLYKNPETSEIKREYIFQIPSNGEDFEDIGRLSKKDLKPAKNLKQRFRIILNLLYANTNISRKEKLGSEMIRLLFCKIWDERYDQDKPPKFKIGFRDKPEDVKKNIEALFKSVKKELVDDGVFDESEKIVIDAKSIAYVVAELERFSLMRTDKDVIGDAFEVFAESKFAGEKGEFFTPREVVKMCVKMIDPKPDEKVFDPACGSGGFLIYALEHVWDRMAKDPRYKGSPDFDGEKKKVAEKCFSGIDKEIDLVKIAKAYMAIVGDGRGSIIQENTLHNYEDWNERSKWLFTNKGESVKKVDVILTNPPFGAKIKVVEDEVLKNFDLGHKWKFNKEHEKWEKTNKVQKTEPQLLFIERCMDFLKDGGRMAIVLPDGVFGNPTDGWVRQWIKERAEILAIVDCPFETFMPHTGTKTSVLFVRKWEDRKQTNYPIFCSVVKKCGHDSRGNDIRKPDETLDEEFSIVADRYSKINNRITNKYERLGFTIYEGKIKNDIFIPRYYNPDTQSKIKEFEDSGKYDMRTIGSLKAEKILSVKGAGSTISKQDYGTGDIPFIRTSDIANLEIRNDSRHKVSREIYLRYKEAQELTPNDILFVKDGGTRIGDTALITEYELEILVQSHIFILRSLDTEKLDPLLLLYLLNSEIVRLQEEDRTFTQATLSTIGNRINEVYLPIPKSKKDREEIIETMHKVYQRAKLKHELNQIVGL